jgi:hypothetical protein
MNTFLPTREEYKDLVKEAISESLDQQLPILIRKATRKQYINTAEAMDLLSCSRKHLYYLRKIEALPYIKEGGMIYYNIDDIDAFMEDNRIS